MLLCPVFVFNCTLRSYMVLRPSTWWFFALFLSPGGQKCREENLFGPTNFFLLQCTSTLLCYISLFSGCWKSSWATNQQCTCIFYHFNQWWAEVTVMSLKKKTFQKFWKGIKFKPKTWELRKTRYQDSGRGVRGRLSLPGMEGNENRIGKKELRVGFVI